MFRTVIMSLPAAALALMTAACQPHAYEDPATTEMQTDPTEIVASVVLPSKVIEVDPPKRFNLTFQNEHGDRGSVYIAKRCSNWQAIPLGTVRSIRWTTYREGDQTWIEPSDPGESIRREICG